MRRQFELAAEDREAVDAHSPSWESVNEGGTTWLLLKSHPIPDGYNVPTAEIALRISPSYPDEQIDMAYFHPPLALKSGKAIGALSTTAIDGREFQQWSRHRTAQNPWRPGLDNIGTHLLQVNSWLLRELEKA